MSHNVAEEYAVLQTGFWRVEIDLARPRIVSLRGDAAGLIDYCQEMLQRDLGGETIAETREGVVRSRGSVGHTIETEGREALRINGIRLGDFALVNWDISAQGDRGETLQVVVSRKILRPIELVTDVPFGLQCVREFALWSAPSLRFGHDPAAGYEAAYSPIEVVARRRVIGYHDAASLPEFVVHGSPSYPDVLVSLDRGHHHVEQHYARHVMFGVSSRDFSSGPQLLDPGEEMWVLRFRLSPQGVLAPVTFRSSDPAVDHFVAGFFDGHLLSAIACDHEYFGNNPYRHAYAPGSIHLVTRGYQVTDRRCWSPVQGDMEARWERHLRRTFAEGRVTRERPVILLDSGVWQDACGKAEHTRGCPPSSALFVTACTHVLLKSGDRAFAAAVFDDLKVILDSLLSFDTDRDGLLEAPTAGTPGTPSSSYNDCLSEGHKDGFFNAVACEAFLSLASLAEFLGEKDAGARCSTVARRIAVAYNDQLWDEEKGRYVGWIDADGVAHDAWYTHTNFPAVVAGLVPEERLARLMRGFMEHPGHHRIFAAGVNLEPVTDGCMEDSLPFGVWLNGGVLLGPAAMELYARAVGLGGECAWAMLRDVIQQWETNRLSQTPVLDFWRVLSLVRDPRVRFTGGNAWTWLDGRGATGAGTEPYLADGGAILWALYTGMLGLRADFQGLSFVPHIPAALRDTEVAIRLMGRGLEIRFCGAGDILGSLTLNGCRVAGCRLRWEDLPDSSIVEVAVNP